MTPEELSQYVAEYLRRAEAQSQAFGKLFLDAFFQRAPKEMDDR